MPFFVIVKVRDLEHVFPNPAVTAGGMSRASIFSTLVSLLIQTSMLFLLSLSLLVGGVSASDRQEVGQIWYHGRREFLNEFVAGISGKGSL